MKENAWNDQRIENIIGLILRAGVLAAAAIVLVGGLVHLSHHGTSHVDYHVFQGDTLSLRTIPGILSGVRTLRGEAIVQFGVLILIATPIARVIFSAIAFAIEKDYLYVVITLVVLATLTYSLLSSTLR